MSVSPLEPSRQLALSGNWQLGSSIWSINVDTCVTPLETTSPYSVRCPLTALANQCIRSSEHGAARLLRALQRQCFGPDVAADPSAPRYRAAKVKLIDKGEATRERPRHHGGAVKECGVDVPLDR